jgi:hypothetical protein
LGDSFRVEFLAAQQLRALTSLQLSALLPERLSEWDPNTLLELNGLRSMTSGQLTALFASLYRPMTLGTLLASNPTAAQKSALHGVAVSI